MGLSSTPFDRIIRTVDILSQEALRKRQELQKQQENIAARIRKEQENQRKAAAENRKTALTNLLEISKSKDLEPQSKSDLFKKIIEISSTPADSPLPNLSDINLKTKIDETLGNFGLSDVAKKQFKGLSGKTFKDLDVKLQIEKLANERIKALKPSGSSTPKTQEEKFAAAIDQMISQNNRFLQKDRLVDDFQFGSGGQVESIGKKFFPGNTRDIAAKNRRLLAIRNKVAVQGKKISELPAEDRRFVMESLGIFKPVSQEGVNTANIISDSIQKIQEDVNSLTKELSQ